MILRSGILRPRRSWLIGLLTWLLGAQLARATQPSIARLWDEENIAAIRIDTPNPPVHARNLFHLSVAMYDVWAAFDRAATGYLYHHKHTSSDVAAARREAISYAAYRILSERYALSRNAVTTLGILNSRMTALGFDPNNFSTDPATPAGLGNSVAALVSEYFIADGARQLQAYQDAPLQEGGYLPNNRPLLTRAYGTLALDPNHWQPLAITNAIDQHNIPASLVQPFLGAQWLGVRPFALSRVNLMQPWIDPGPPPQLGGASDADYRAAAVEVIRRSSELTPDDGVLLDISPSAIGNNPLGSNDGRGRPLNPVSGEPYAANVVKRGDFARVLAEFWADGPASETPPGHWNVIANQVADSPEFAKRIGGTGPVVDDLEWDVKTYFALNAALHDAACAAWSLKRFYNGWRPIEAIRWLGQRGQASDPAGPSYDAFGLPLVPGLIEVVTPETSQTGGRHEGMTNGNVVLHCWPGQPMDPTNQYSGVRWINAGDWLPFQKRTFVTPAFPGYVSGHSTFSRAAAEVLTAITGSPYFPGGLGTHTTAVDSLAFEKGPTTEVQLQWATYFDAADQAGQSRIWGGIHPSVDDLPGRRIGAQCGQGVWALARKYFDGSILQTPIVLRITPGPITDEARVDSLRGLSYRLQSTADLTQPFADEPDSSTRAVDTSVTLLAPSGRPHKFYRVQVTPIP
jgi:hypothetical protein